MSSEFDRLKRRQKLDDKRRRKHGNNGGNNHRDGARYRDPAPDKTRGARLARWQDQDD
jgi:hypothetical protein